MGNSIAQGMSKRCAATERERDELRAEIEQLRAVLKHDRLAFSLEREFAEQAQREIERLRAGVEQIRDASGMACAQMETCSHRGCNGSISAHLIALELLGSAKDG